MQEKIKVQLCVMIEDDIGLTFAISREQSGVVIFNKDIELPFFPVRNMTISVSKEESFTFDDRTTAVWYVEEKYLSLEKTLYADSLEHKRTLLRDYITSDWVITLGKERVEAIGLKKVQ